MILDAGVLIAVERGDRNALAMAPSDAVTQPLSGSRRGHLR